MGDGGVGGLQAVGQLPGRGVMDIEAFQQLFLETFHRLLQALDLGIVLARHRGPGDVQVADVHQVAVADRRRAKDHVLQLAHIARPAVAQQRWVGARGQPAYRALDLGAGLLHEVAGQQQDVLAAFAQWRYLDGQHIEAVEQVLAEAALGDHFLQVAMGSAEDAHIDLDLAVATDPAKAAVVEKAQQLGLQVGRHLANFIEEYRALVGQFHQPWLAPALGSGEGAGGITEQLALGEVFRQRRAVQGQERRAMASADGVAGAGHQFLAGAGFTLDQQRRIQGRDPLRPSLEGADRRRLAEQGIEALGMIVVQGRQLLADAIGLVQGQQGAGIGDGHGVEQQGLAIDRDLPQRQAKPLFQQRSQQAGVGEQLGHAFSRRLAAVQGHQRRVGQQHLAGAVQGQHRVGHGGQQGIELQVAALPGEDVDHRHRLHTAHVEQGVAQFIQDLRAQGRGVDVDVGRHHFHRIQVEVAPAQQGQDFLGDADAVDEADVDTHGGGGGFWGTGGLPVCLGRGA